MIQQFYLFGPNSPSPITQVAVSCLCLYVFLSCLLIIHQSTHHPSLKSDLGLLHPLLCSTQSSSLFDPPHPFNFIQLRNVPLQWSIRLPGCSYSCKIQVNMAGFILGWVACYVWQLRGGDGHRAERPWFCHMVTPTGFRWSVL